MRYLIFIFLFFSSNLTVDSALANWGKNPESPTVKKRNYIQVVGSSTVYPFAATIAEEFGRNTKFHTPIIEATGTGGGFKLFCSGVGINYPDFINASRKIEPSEIQRCKQNGIKNPLEIKIGYDGIILANSVLGNNFKLDKKQLFLALAEKIPDPKSKKLIANPYKKWSDINKNLPDIEIKIYGPPATSGTRDAFVELVMEDVCIKMPEFILAFLDKKLRQKQCRIIRSDGHFIEAGENDNLIVQKLKNDNDAIGIFGFSFLEENRNIIKPVKIENIFPTFDSIASGEYKISRPLFIYFKNEHLNLVAGIKEFINEIVSYDTLGKDGYLMQKGLIPLDDEEVKKIQDLVK